MSYIELPNVEGTAESRIAALRESRDLLKGEPRVTTPAIFGSGGTVGGEVADSAELINLATYIETGHAYADLHPTGKRRPLVRNIHVTLVAPGAPDQEDIQHLIGHIKDGSFAEFVEDMLKREADQPDAADSDESTDNN